MKWWAGWSNKLESRLLGEISINSDMQMTPPLRQKVKKNQRASWWRWKSEKAGLKQLSRNEYHSIQYHYFLENWWGHNGNSERLFFLGFKKSLQMVTASMKLRPLLLGRRAVIKLDSILKNRDITLLTKVHIVRVMFFPLVMYGCESWTIKDLGIKELMLLSCGAGEDS